MTATGIPTIRDEFSVNPDVRIRRSLTYRLLGPVEVLRGGERRTPGPPKQRGLLALLALHANQSVNVSTIIDELWGARPPRSALAALQVYITGVRRSLVDMDELSRLDIKGHPVLRTNSSGYQLMVEPGCLDLARFRTMVVQGRRAVAAGRCVGAGEMFRAALGLWRGTALGDLERKGILARHSVRLEDERLDALQERIDIDRCQGRVREVVGEVEDLCVRYPLREGFHRQLMQALHLVGRRADALRWYTRAYRIIMDEAGIEPGPELRRLQQAILAGRDLADDPHAGH
jgi:SARP family transcriptional regulator, regulator of embCAB operon